MVDEFASVWPIVALEGVGDLIGDARPGLVAVDAGRRLAFANPAAAGLFDAPTAWGAPLAVDRRLADRIVRFAGRAAPGEETRELLRFTQAGRPSLRTVVFRRPIDADDAVIAVVDGAHAEPAAASIADALAPFAADGGLVALFDADGAVLGAVGDLELADGVVETIETALAEADEIAVLERTLTAAGARHDLVLVRLGDRPDARRLLRLGPAEPLATGETAAPLAPAPLTPAPLASTVPVATPETATTAIDEPFDDDLLAEPFLAPPLLPSDLFDETEEAEAPATAEAIEPAESADETVPSMPAAPRLAATPDETPDVAEPRPLVVVEERPPLTAHDVPTPLDDEDALPEPAPIATPSVEPAVPATETEAAAPAPTVDAEEPTDEPPAPSDFVFAPLDRPLRFVWQMDAARRFTFVSDEFADVVGPNAGDILDRSWDEVAARLDLDPDRAVADVLSRHDTWSGRTVLWPIDGTALRLPVDLAALPAFDRGRTFTGFRGFGICRTDEPRPDPNAVGLRLAAPGAAPLVPEPAPEASEEPVEAPDEAPVATLPALAEEAIELAPTEPATAITRVAEEIVEPPLFPDDGESAIPEVDHPIEPAFAGDIGDDPLFHHADVIAPAAPEVAEPIAPEITAPAAAPSETIAPPAAEPPTLALDGEAAPLALAEVSLAMPESVITEPAIAAPEAPAGEPLAAATPAPRPAPRLVTLADLARPPEEATRLSVPERNAFRQIAEALGARIEGEAEALPAPLPRTVAAPAPRRPASVASTPLPLDVRLLDRLPLALALLRDDTLLHANEPFLSLLHYPDLDSLRAAGGIDALFAGPHAARRFAGGDSRPIPILARDGAVVPCDATIASVPIEGGGAAVLLLLTERDGTRSAAAPAAAVAASATGGDADRERIAELQAIVDTATDGVLILDASGLVLSANAAAEALFGVERRAMIGRPLGDRLAPESRRSAMDYLDGLAANGVASVLNDGREVIGVVAPEGLIPLFMTIGRVSTGPVAKYCAVLRDITQWKKSEEELTTARRRAEEASIHKSDFLAKISHEIRTPLNAIIGFSELMLDERFGPIGNDRYKDYLRDIHVSGSHIMSLVNDLLDLSKVEAGKMDLRFEAVPLAEVVSECVALMQPQANRERIIIRSSLPTDVPPVVADPRSMRQVVLNLLSNAVKFTPAGGQVIVSITLEDNGEVVLRVRDTGYGMSEKELQTAMEPFRQLHTTGSRGGTGLGLPLTKALTEANRASFRIDSTVGQGTLASIAFPVTRVLAG